MSSKDRAEIMSLITEAVDSGARKFKACEILDVEIRTIERWMKTPEDKRCGSHKRPSNALTEEERAEVLKTANSAEYANLTPWQIVPKLADKGIYIASESSFYRILKAEKMLVHRSKSNPRTYTKPAPLIASEPNQIWSWDITYLKSHIKGRYYYLYLPIDIFSRKIVYWEIHENESAELASSMITKACFINEIKEAELFLHSDNGGPMKGALMLATLQRLGIMPSFSRPSVSNDNPYSESIFKTLKYCPSFPDKGFESIDQAREWTKKFVYWYNNIHFHSGINFVTPADKYNGADQKILQNRHEVYELAKSKNPNRWSKQTRNWSPINIVKLNPGKTSQIEGNYLAA